MARKKTNSASLCFIFEQADAKNSNYYAATHLSHPDKNGNLYTKLSTELLSNTRQHDLDVATIKFISQKLRKIAANKKDINHIKVALEDSRLIGFLSKIADGEEPEDDLNLDVNLSKLWTKRVKAFSTVDVVSVNEIDKRDSIVEQARIRILQCANEDNRSKERRDHLPCVSNSMHR